MEVVVVVVGVVLCGVWVGVGGCGGCGEDVTLTTMRLSISLQMCVKILGARYLGTSPGVCATRPPP